MSRALPRQEEVVLDLLRAEPGQLVSHAVITDVLYPPEVDRPASAGRQSHSVVSSLRRRGAPIRTVKGRGYAIEAGSDMALRISSKIAAAIGIKKPRAPRKPKAPVTAGPVRPENQVQESILTLIEAEFSPDVEVMHTANQAPMSLMKNVSSFVRSRKKAGVRKGWPDLTIYFSIGQSTFIEVKRIGKEPDDDQIEIHRRLRALGFIVTVAHNDAEAREGLLVAGVPTRGGRMPSNTRRLPSLS